MRNLFMLSGIYACLFAACASDQENNQEEKFPVTNPIVVDTTFTQDYVADIQAVQNVEIRARVKGYLEKIHVDEGQIVQAGQLLFTISSKEFEQDVQRANAQLKSAIAEAKMAEVEVANTKQLNQKNIVSTSVLDMAIAKLEAAQAKTEEAKSALQTANLNLSFAEIRAPFKGIINRHPLKEGSLIDEGTLLTTISNNTEVFAYFKVSEREYLSLMQEKEKKHQQTVSLILANGQLFPQKGKIETEESEIDKNTGNLSFRARFSNPGGVLKHGASGKIQLLNQLSGALIIPQKATFEIQENTYVYAVGKDNTVQAKSIKIAQRLSQFYVIESGLSPHDVIVYEGIQRIKEGDKIISEPKAMKAIMAELAKPQ